MKITLIASLLLLLTGCASNCKDACVAGFGPGNSMFDVIAQHYDTQDPCQMTGKPTGYQYPGFCGASKGKTYIKRINPNTYTYTVNK